MERYLYSNSNSTVVKRGDTTGSKNKTNRNNDDIEVILVTGKWGYNDTYKDQMEQRCAYLQQVYTTSDETEMILHPNNIYCYYNESLFENSTNPEEIQLYQRFVNNQHLHYRMDPNHTSKRGGGYWFHKSIILYHHMLLSSTDDTDTNTNKDTYILWLDWDRFIYHPQLTTMIHSMRERTADIVIQQLSGNPEYIWTKQDMIAAFEQQQQQPSRSSSRSYMDNGTEIPLVLLRNTHQMNAGAILIRNSIRMRQFIKDVYIECMTDYHMISDEVSILPNDPNFRDHRHDQSLIGLAIKYYGTNQTRIVLPINSSTDTQLQQTLLKNAYYTFQLGGGHDTDDDDDNDTVTKEPMKCPFSTTV